MGAGREGAEEAEDMEEEGDRALNANVFGTEGSEGIGLTVKKMCD